ncbi:MAG: polysulfide reductase NrfD [Dehalococcoidia bacterium]|nr:polysulfide reductase NrfD [Dehalococcoidia bacterium]
MIENIFRGGKKYWLLVSGLLVLMAAGMAAYLEQWNTGLAVTGLSRDVSWGLYIANFTFFVGVAASAVMIVIPYYLHNSKEFRRILILGEFMAVAACLVAITFILVDLGQPSRVLNIILYPSPGSIIFWDVVVLSIYLLLNIVLGWVALDAEYKEVAPPAWLKPVAIVSVVWAISIHTVTAFIYAGLAARAFWLTALLAPRFLASAFASGPALLILIALAMKKWGGFEPGDQSLDKVAKIVTYAIIITVFFLLLEIFTVFYSQEPGAMSHFQYLLFGLDNHYGLVPWIWTSILLACAAIILLVIPSMRKNQLILALACAAVFISIWIDKGLGLIVPGFIPTPLGDITEYTPTALETLITMGVWATGGLILALLLKVVLAIRQGQRG